MIKIKQTITALLLGLSVNATQAIEFKNAPEFVVPAETSIPNETWRIAERVDFKGTALQDLFLLASESLRLDGKFQDDVWGASAATSFNGTSAGSVRLAAQNSITISGNIEGNLLVAVPNINNATIKLTESSRVKGSTICFGDNVLIEGATSDMTIYANRATIGGHIQGDLLVAARDIVVLNNTKVDGDLRYISGEELLVPSTVHIGGNLSQMPLPVKKGTDMKSRLMRQGYFFLAALLVSLPFLNLCPMYVASAVAAFRMRPWRCLLIGFVAMFIIPFCCITLSASIIGMPLGLILGAWYATVLYLSKFVFALLFGVIIFRWKKPSMQQSTLLATATGLLFIYLLTSIDSIKAPIWLMIMMYGTGALILATFKRVQIVMPTPSAMPSNVSDDSNKNK